MTFASLFSAILLVTSAYASPFFTPESFTVKTSSDPISLKTTVKLHGDGSMSQLVAKDKARLQVLSGKPRGQGNRFANTSGNTSVTIAETGFLSTVEVQVGNPPTSYQLIVDTGSSNTFVGANKKYTPTSSSKDTGDEVGVSYGSGKFIGEEYTDDVTIGSAVITSQSIGVASFSEGFNGLDGILGLGPDVLTKGTLRQNQSATIPTVTDNMAQQGKASSALVGVSFSVTTGSGDNEGSLDFGVPDSSKFIGDITYVPITSASPANDFWGIDQSITYGDTKIPILSKTAGIVDTGTTLLFLPSDAFNAYTAATGAVQDPESGMLTIDNPDKLKSLFFTIGNSTYEFSANAQMLPRSLTSQMGGGNATYLIFQNTGIPSGEGEDFINGFTFLQRFYSVFDTTNSRVGFAITSQTNATTN